VVKLTQESIHVVVLGFSAAIITEKDIREEFVCKTVSLVSTCLSDYLTDLCCCYGLCGSYIVD